jgi:hypothetical protein
MKTHKFENGVILALNEYGIFEFHLPNAMDGETFKKFLVSFKLSILKAKEELLRFFLDSNKPQPKNDKTPKVEFLINYGAFKLVLSYYKIGFSFKSQMEYRLSKLRKPFFTTKTAYLNQLNRKKVNKFQTNN